jgi:hypothetical protein
LTLVNLRTIEPHRNGKYEAPRQQDGASTISAYQQPQPTVFLDEISNNSWRTLLYGLRHFQIGGAPASRYLIWLLLLLAALWAVGLFPARWWGAGICLALAAAWIVCLRHLERNDFVRFEPADAPSLPSARLSPADKVPIYATGRFAVEGKHQRSSYLPGFFRTFATGEHAVLCLVRDHRLLGIAKRPADEVGMWYAFFTPDVIESVYWGQLHFSRQAQPAIAVNYRLAIPGGGRRGRDLLVNETLYIACTDGEHARMILADLLHSLPDGAASS